MKRLIKILKQPIKPEQLNYRNPSPQEKSIRTHAGMWIAGRLTENSNKSFVDLQSQKNSKRQNFSLNAAIYTLVMNLNRLLMLLLAALKDPFKTNRQMSEELLLNDRRGNLIQGV